MGEQPIWKVTLRDELDLDSVEALLAGMPSWQTGGTGLRIERVDVVKGSTGMYVSGSEADAQMLLARIRERHPKPAGRPQVAACTLEELRRTGPEASRRPKPKRRR